VPHRIVRALDEHVEASWGHELTIGPAVMMPPRILTRHAPSNQRCHRALSMPRANTSMRPDCHDTAPGSLSITPPSDSQLCQEPSNHLCHNALSEPLTNTSRRPGAHELTAGPAVMMPPKDSQSRHAPSNQRCHSALSMPRANTSMRPDDHETAAGEPSMTPPKDSHPLQPPSNHLCQTALSDPLTKVECSYHELTDGPAVMILVIPSCSKPWRPLSFAIKPLVRRTSSRKHVPL
jgi:hypothetical protein